VIRDTFARSLRNLRLSVTDRCNLRCAYCMPEEEYAWLPRADILTFEEIARLVDVFAGLGVDKVLHGQPLLRKDLPRLVKMIAADHRLRDLAITTNGILWQEAQASATRASARHGQPRHAPAGALPR
jgi:cyclic pyranopterin phosphate synthase